VATFFALDDKIFTTAPQSAAAELRQNPLRKTASFREECGTGQSILLQKADTYLKPARHLVISEQVFAEPARIEIATRPASNLSLNIHTPKFR
jgi:hypothetical protein